MSALQGSLLDLADEPRLGEIADGITRTALTAGAWVEHRPGWLAGSDALYDDLATTVPWHAEERQMFDNWVRVPRLTKFYSAHERLPHPLLGEAREALSEHYEAELGERFVTAGLCWYRDGRDSVAWHGDRIGRSREQDTMIAILSVGSARTLALRPRAGGTSIGFSLGHGDLVVMGGTCQRTWDHAIPKVSGHVGGRISIQFRVAGVR